jgi:1-acyl-sn-glycerol-3-phosphate acyltransferase
MTAAGRPFLRPFLVWAWGGPALAVASCLGFLLWPFLGGSRAFWTVAPTYIRMMAWAFGIDRQLDGWSALPAPIRDGSQPAIFVGNHTSLLDPPLLISTLPCRPVFLAKRELFRVPFLGWVMTMAGFIPVDRGNRTKAIESMQQAAHFVRAGQCLIAFPEGTRSRDGALLPFKKGVFTLAVEAGVPVVPFAIHGGVDIVPKGTWRVAGGPYRIRLGTPLAPGTHPEQLREAAAAAVAGLMAGGIGP